MTFSTKTVGNKKITVRFLNNDENGFLDMTSIEFKMAFNKIKGNFNFGIETSFGSVGNFNFTTLTNKELQSKFYEIK
tara:strand:+ start:426 stop:656 length:231 start_codon:yes stop_codon:yes gene_type:complete